MYFLIGLPRLLKAYAWVSAFVAIASFCAANLLFGSLPDGPPGWYNAVFGAVGKGLLVSGIVASLGQTALFPWACRRTVLKRVFPCIDGKWGGVLNSNIVAIADRDQELKGKISIQPTEAVISIKARLLTVSMSLRSRPLNSKSPYLESDTILMGVRKVGTDQSLQLIYTFEASVDNYLSTDSSQHFGSAILTLREGGDEQILDGLYWTNRNWKQARNTAGVARFRRPWPPPSGLTTRSD